MLSKLPHSLLCALTFLFLAAPLAAHTQQTLQVPSQLYPNIQDAINAANDGDTVSVAAGTYYENLDFLTKTITLTGPTVSAGATPTAILDGGFKAPAINLTGGVNPETSTVENLVIRHGGSVATPYPFQQAFGAVFIQNAAPTILNNTIMDSACYGIEAELASPTIQGNTITATEGGQCSLGGGSAIFINGDQPLRFGGYAHSTVIGNFLHDNIESGLDSTDTIAEGGGGGIAVAGSSVIMNNQIYSNSSNGSAGGGIAVIDGTGLTIVQNLIYANSGCGGGGIALPPSGIDSRIVALIANNTIADNSSNPPGISGCTPSNQLYESAADASEDGPDVIIVNNIFSGSTTTGSAIDCAVPIASAPSEATQPIFDHNILYNAGGNFFGQNCIDVSAKYGNLTANPDFVLPGSADFSLNKASPAIDAGNNSALQLFQNLTGQPLLTDIGGTNPRLQDNSGNGYPIVDIGAYEFAAVTEPTPPTTIVLTTSAYTGHPGYTYTLTATVQGGSVPPAGTVTFFLDGVQIAGSVNPAPIVAGVATLANFLMPPGVHALKATYAGQGGASPAVSIINIVDITLISTTVTFQYCGLVNGVCSNAANTPVVGQPVQFTVTSSAADGTIPGPITLTDDPRYNDFPQQSLMSGQTFVTSSLRQATHNITAEYAETLTYAGASETRPVVIYGYSTATALSCGPLATVPLGSLIPLTVTVTSANGTPIGSVDFQEGKNDLGTVTLSNGMAGHQATATAGYNGYDTFIATYIPLPGSGFAASYGTCSVKVQSLTLALSSSANPAPAYTPITFTANLAGSSIPTGAYTITIGSSTYPMQASANGASATYTTSDLAPGNYTVTATFTPSDGTAPTTAQLSGNPQVVTAATGDFTLTGPTTLSVPTESSASGTLTLTSIQGFQGTVALSCNLPLPTTYTCTLSSTSVPLAVNGAANSTVTLAPRNLHAFADPNQRTRRQRTANAVLASLLPLTLLCLASFASRRRRTLLRSLLSLAVLAILAASTTACGPDVYSVATQPGTYPLTVTATGTTKGGAAPTTHTLNINLVLTP